MPSAYTRERGEREGGRDLVNFETEFHAQQEGVCFDSPPAFDPDPSGARIVFHFQYDSPPHPSALVHLYVSSCCMT